MPGACREDRDVTGLQRQRSSFLAAKPDFSISARNSQNLVYLRMIVNVIIDAVSPAIAPSVCIEKHLHDGCWIKSFGQFDGAAINDERPCWMIGYKSIILEPELIRLSLPHKSGDSLLARSCETGDVLDHFLAGSKMLIDAASKAEVSLAARSELDLCVVAHIRLGAGNGSKHHRCGSHH